MKYNPYSPTKMKVSFCEWLFSKLYILKDVERTDSEASNKGHVDHTVQELILLACLKGERPTPQQVHAWLNEAMDKYPLKEEESIHFVREACLNFLYGMDRWPFKLDCVVGVEEKLGAGWDGKQYVPCSFDDPNAVIRGIIDIAVIDGTKGWSYDHKNQRNVETADTFQQGVYAFLMKVHYPYLEEVYSVLHFCAPELNFWSKPAIWGPEELAILRADFERYIRYAEDINPETAVATAGHQCRYCSVIHECPIGAKFTAEGKVERPGVIASSQDAVRYAEHYVFMEQWMKELKKHLNRYCKDVGPVPLRDMIVEMRHSEGRDLRKQAAIREVFKTHNIPFEYYASLSTDGAKRAFADHSENSDFLGDFERMAPSKMSPRFGAFILK